MAQAFKAVQLTGNVYWVGAIDWNLRNFHGYETRRGTTYNAYLVRGETGYILIDTVKPEFQHELISRIESICPLTSIKAIISGHAEMDHSGLIAAVRKRIAPDAVIYTSPMGANALNAIFNGAIVPCPIDTNTPYTIDGRHFRFIETRMMHWPDSMWTLFEDEHTMFTNDAFGMHLAGLERWYDQYPKSILETESTRYYANILMPYSSVVSKACADFALMNLNVQVLCPDHGPIWRGPGITHIIERYKEWSSGQYRKKAVIIFDTMWHSTEKMARALSEGIQEAGWNCIYLPLSCSHRSDAAEAMLNADLLLVGSPTLNGCMLPSVADVLCYLKGLKPAPRAVAAFGSYGWSPLGAKSVAEQLSAFSKDLAAPLLVCHTPTEEDLERCRIFGRDFANNHSMSASVQSQTDTQMP